MAYPLSLVEYTDSESSDDQQTLSIAGKRKQLSSIHLNDIMEPPTKRQKLFDHKKNKPNNNESSDDNNDDDIIHNKKRKKIKLKRLSKPSSVLSKNEKTNIEFLTSQSKDYKLEKMETEIFNKHNTKQIERQQQEKDRLELAKQSIAEKEQQNKIRTKLSALSSSVKNRDHKNPNRKTVKEKEKAKRKKGQSSHHSWKSETFMLLRQQFD